MIDFGVGAGAVIEGVGEGAVIEEQMMGNTALEGRFAHANMNINAQQGPGLPTFFQMAMDARAAMDINASSETVWPFYKEHCYTNNSMNKKLEAAKKWLKSRGDK